MENLRATGRSTRMLEYAVEQAKTGKRVIIYSDSHRLQNALIDEIVKLSVVLASQVDDRHMRVKLRIAVGEIVFARIDAEFDWVLLRGQSVQPEVVTLVDHAAIERMYPAVTDMLYRFIT